MAVKLDLGYKIEEQNIIVFEIRLSFSNPKKVIHPPIAKTTFVKSKNHWQVFWMRADLKWHNYTPKTIKEFCKLIEEDKHNCFFG